MYDLVLFLHVLGAIGVFLALTVEWFLVARLEQAQGDVELVASLRPFAKLPLIGLPATILVLLSGIYLAETASLWRQGWPVAALVGLLLLALFGIAFGSRPAQMAARLLGAGHGVPVELRSVLRSKGMRRSVYARSWIGIGIVYLMTLQPAGRGATTVLGVSLALALIALVPWHRARLQDGAAHDQTPANNP